MHVGVFMNKFFKYYENADWLNKLPILQDIFHGIH